MTHHEVEKYSSGARVLHWINTASFVALFLTGLVLFIPALGPIAGGGWTRIVHRVGAVVFVATPIIYLLFNWSGSWRGVVKAFTWGSADIGWLKAAPRFYFLKDEKAMPPQDEMNSGQKLWLLIALVSGVVFAISGIIMWLGMATMPAGLLQSMVLLHDIAFIVAGVMLLVHIYLAVFHPLMTEAWGSMISGKISAEYAKKHHGKWYEEVSRAQK